MENFPWLIKETKEINKKPTGHGLGVHLCRFSQLQFQEWEYQHKATVPLNLVKLSDFKDHDEVGSVYTLLEKQGLDKLWYTDGIESFSTRYTHMFYANLWTDFVTENEPFYLHSVIGVPVKFSLQNFCDALNVRNEGVDKFDVFGWNRETYGLTEEEVKSELGFLPSQKLQRMPLDNRVLLGIVMACMNGKATRNPSNLDF